jgi:sterol desaturase/sphingolipid hydroxylase (fatty acid hydroxylase superfamily)/uncharacterized membrane protein YhhN
MSKIIVFAFPVFLFFIALELWLDRRARAGASSFGWSDTISSLNLGLMSQISGVLGKFIGVALYGAVFGSVALFPDADLWTHWYGWVLALVLYDFCYYWLHRAGHEVAVLWAAHAVHHQSQYYNLSTALRQTSSGALLGWVFYLPMALLGVPPVLFGIVALVDLLYQFWVHTEHVGKLGWFDRVFCSPSNHRVHHAINERYLDRNYGGIWVLWDRWFGTFEPEGQACIYGTRKPLNSWDPLWANVSVYASLVRQSARTPRWSDKLRLWFKPPGWRPAGSEPHAPFEPDQVHRYQPLRSAWQQGFAALQFALMLGLGAAYLWVADDLPVQEAALDCLALCAGLWAVGAYTQGRLGELEVLMVQAGAWATLGALGLLPWYGQSKPLVVLLAIALVLAQSIGGSAARGAGAGRFGLGKPQALLLGALLCSVCGDVLLSWGDAFFIPGLAAFLCAHLFYIARLGQDAPWFADRKNLLGVLVFGAAMLGLLWSSLGEPVLKLAVAAYICAICLMAAQALGRAQALGDRASGWVAVGACVFMLSDALIAIDRFLTPVPLAPLWILGSYYAAQMLLVHHLLRAGTSRSAKP